MGLPRVPFTQHRDLNTAPAAASLLRDYATELSLHASSLVLFPLLSLPSSLDRDMKASVRHNK